MKRRKTTRKTVFQDIYGYDITLSYDIMGQKWLAQTISNGGKTWKQFRGDTPETAVQALRDWYDDIIDNHKSFDEQPATLDDDDVVGLMNEDDHRLNDDAAAGLNKFMNGGM